MAQSFFTALIIALALLNCNCYQFNDTLVDLYERLEVSTTASQNDITRAYRKAALKYHPDKNVGNEDATAKFQSINEANDILSDPATRRKFDRDLNNHRATIFEETVYTTTTTAFNQATTTAKSRGSTTTRRSNPPKGEEPYDIAFAKAYEHYFDIYHRKGEYPSGDPEICAHKLAQFPSVSYPMPEDYRARRSSPVYQTKLNFDRQNVLMMKLPIAYYASEIDSYHRTIAASYGRRRNYYPPPPNFEKCSSEKLLGLTNTDVVVSTSFESGFFRKKAQSLSLTLLSFYNGVVGFTKEERNYDTWKFIPSAFPDPDSKETTFIIQFTPHKNVDPTKYFLGAIRTEHSHYPSTYEPGLVENIYHAQEFDLLCSAITDEVVIRASKTSIYLKLKNYRGDDKGLKFKATEDPKTGFIIYAN